MAHILQVFVDNIVRKSGMTVLLLALFCLLPTMMLTAQITTSAISGNVSDSKGPIQEAVVTAVHMPTGKHYYVFTNEKGNYVINNVLAGGPYIVRVERLNYKTAIFSDVDAPLGETAVVNAFLERTSKRIEEVYIFGDGENSPMNINHSGIGIHLNSTLIEMTPSVSRSLYDILKLTPQSVTTQMGAAFGGANYRGSYVTVDGASFNNSFGY